MLDSNFWVRTFHRGIDPITNEPHADSDTIADSQFLDKNFTDHFGSLLRDQYARARSIGAEKFAKLNTYNKLCSAFHSKSYCHVWSLKLTGTDDPDTIVQTYCIADGVDVPKHKQQDWFRSELRFISLIVPTDKNHEKKAVAPITSVSWAEWFILIAASSAINSPRDILHVMSWKKSVKQFRYYARDVIMDSVRLFSKPSQSPSKTDPKRGWVYLCNSDDAFDETEKAYLGPLNGHVNGGLVMKEIHKPWLHWLVGGRSVDNLISPELAKTLQSAKWLTAPGYPPLIGATVQSAESLERIVLDSVRQWFENRRENDFFEGSPDEDPITRTKPTNIQRWAAHFLLTTNINIIAVPTSDWVIPQDFVYNYETLRGRGDLLPNHIHKTSEWQKAQLDPGSYLEEYNRTNPFGEKFSDADDWYKRFSVPTFDYSPGAYMLAARQMKLCTLQQVPVDTPGVIQFVKGTMSGGVDMRTLLDGQEDIFGGTELAFAVQQWGEGDSPWVTLQSSVEDAMGVFMAQRLYLGADKSTRPNGGRQLCPLFSERAFSAIMMVDFWNPIFSWRRLRLMQYIPIDTYLMETDPVTGQPQFLYELEKRFVDNIKKAMNSEKWVKKDYITPEEEFLASYGAGTENGLPIIAHQIRVHKYTRLVANRLRTDAGVLDYLKLAESRRRMFRPLPMNFFGSNLPYCLGIKPDAPWVEMLEDGTTQKIPQDGIDLLTGWLGRLSGADPTVIPEAEKRTERMTVGKPPVPVRGLPKISTMRMACQASIIMSNPAAIRPAGGCPYMAKAFDQGLVE